MVLLPFQLLLLNHSGLLSGLQAVEDYLQGPTLLYHDGRGDLDVVARSLAATRPVIIAESPNHPDSDNQFTPRSIVLLASSPEPLVPSLRLWRLWSAQSRVLLVLEEGADVRAWLSSLWRWTRAVDVVAMVLADTPEFFTWFPYQPTECSNVSTIVQLNASSLYPRKIGTYFNSCPLKAVTSILPPFVVDDFHGIESHLFQDLGKKLGMSTSYTRLDKLYVWTQFSTAGEPVNGLKLLWENKLDVMFSSSKINYRSVLYAEFLMPHSEDSPAWFVSGPLPAPHTTAIYRAFAPRTWACTLGASAVIFFTTLMILYLERQRLDAAFLLTLAISLSLPAYQPSSRTCLMFLTVAYLYSMHMTTAYQASFIIFLSEVPREKPISTMEDLVESNLKIKFSTANREILDDSKSPLMIALLRSDRSSFTPYLPITDLADPTKRIAMLGPKVAFKFIVTTTKMYYDEFGYPRFRIFSDPDAGTSLVCLYASKGHPLYPLMDRYLLYLIEAGMPQHYVREVARKPRFRHPDLKPFGMENMEGTFYLYIFMMVVSFSIFLVELIVSVSRRRWRHTTVDEAVVETSTPRAPYLRRPRLLLLPRFIAPQRMVVVPTGVSKAIM